MGAHAGASPGWEQMWRAGIGKGDRFDVGGPSSTLVGELARTRYATGRGLRALVPGCGRAYDALELARHGFEEVVAVDLAPTACEAARQELRASRDPAASRVQVECADFFQLQGKYDFVWDCTFLCALDPSVRPRWAAKHMELLAEGGHLLACVFPICERAGGPPYALSVDLVLGLLEPHGVHARVIDRLPLREWHRPGGGVAASGEPGTALIVFSRADKPAAADCLGCL